MVAVVREAAVETAAQIARSSSLGSVAWPRRGAVPQRQLVVGTKVVDQRLLDSKYG